MADELGNKVAAAYALVAGALQAVDKAMEAFVTAKAALVALNVPRPEVPLMAAVQVGTLDSISGVVGVTRDGKSVKELEFKRDAEPADLMVAFVADTDDYDLTPGEFVRFGEEGSYRYMVAIGMPHGDYQDVVPCAAPALLAEVVDSSDADGDEVGTLTINMAFDDAMVDGVLKVAGDQYDLLLAAGRYDVTDAVGEVRAFTTDSVNTGVNDHWVVIQLDPVAEVVPVAAGEDDGA